MLIAALVYWVLGASLPGQLPTSTPNLTSESSGATLVLRDGSELYVEPRESIIHLSTPYGNLSIDRKDIVSIEFGFSTPPALRERIAAAERDIVRHGLASAAWSVLVDAREYAYPALRRLVAGDDSKTAEKAREMIRVLDESYPAEHLRRINQDRVRTRYSRYIGRIENRSIAVRTPQFGHLQLATEHLARLSLSPARPAEHPVTHAAPDPGSLMHHAGAVGQVFHFVVTAQPGGAVWGSDVYTTDSTLSTVALHAGVLKPGETGVVQVTILPGQNAYEGSTRNGVTTMPYGPYPSSFRISKPTPRPSDDDDP